MAARKTKPKPGRTREFNPRTAVQRRADVERRAYEIYLQRGKLPGHEMDDWLQAEREVFERDESEKYS